MDYIIICLLFISILVIGISFFQNKKNQMGNKMEIKELRESIETLKHQGSAQHAEYQKNNFSAIQQFSEASSLRLNEQFNNLRNTFTEKLVEETNTIKESVESSLYSYLTQEVEEIQEWQELANEEINNATAIRILETSLNKFPGNPDLIQLFTDRINPLLNSDNSNIQKRAIERYNRATRVFLDNCAPDYWEEAKELYEDALTLGNRYMKVQLQHFEKTAEKIIRELENIMEYDILDSQQLKRVEELDKQLSKDTLTSFEKLNTRYNTVTQKLFKQITPEADNVLLQDYNLSALAEFKKAFELFNSNTTFYRTGTGLKQLVTLLGAWDQSHLTPATQIYFQSVYSEIFTKLNPADKPVITELMLKTNKELVFA